MLFIILRHLHFWLYFDIFLLNNNMALIIDTYLSSQLKIFVEKTNKCYLVLIIILNYNNLISMLDLIVIIFCGDILPYRVSYFMF